MEKPKSHTQKTNNQEQLNIIEILMKQLQLHFFFVFAISQHISKTKHDPLRRNNFSTLILTVRKSSRVESQKKIVECIWQWI